MSDKDNTKLSLATPESELENKLLNEDDVSSMKDIIELFNLNIQKKNIIRINKLNNLQDKVYNQIERRLEKYPDNFSNKDLLDYFKVFQDTIDKSNVSAEDIKVPQIQVNQQNINISNSLSVESRRKITDTVKSILNKYQNSEISEIPVVVEEVDN